MLILFVTIYNLLSKPINRLQTEAAKTGATLKDGRELQASWNGSLIMRVPLLAMSLLAQCLTLILPSGVNVAIAQRSRVLTICVVPQNLRDGPLEQMRESYGLPGSVTCDSQQLAIHK
jgi:hypothetical protein